MEEQKSQLNCINGVKYKTDDNANEIANEITNGKVKPYKTEILWRRVIALTTIHLMGVYAVYLVFTGVTKWQSELWFWFMGFLSGYGTLVGAHRLWTHRSYKAKWPLRLVLMILQTLAFQMDIYDWCRDHRVHHKYSETDADPHNSNRGFFFAHMGWLMCRKHPDVRSKGKTLDLSDVWGDPIVRFQRRFYYPLVLLIWGIIPVSIPMYFWNERIVSSISLNFFRYLLGLHYTWLVNSAAHLYGNQPYDKTLNPRENRSVTYASMGEGYHNYHHAFPYDYSASEYGWKSNFNPATGFIDFCAWIGLAYDRKKAPKEVIKNRMKRVGDGTSIAIINIWFEVLIAIIISMWPVIISSFLRIIKLSI